MTTTVITARQCRSCPTMVWDLVHEGTGRHAPIEVEPKPDGNIAVNLDAGTYRLPGFDFRWPAGPRYVNHFKNCPAASRFRRSRPVVEKLLDRRA